MMIVISQNYQIMIKMVQIMIVEVNVTRKVMMMCPLSHYH